MSGHRVELRVSFTVNDDSDGGRIVAEALVQELEYVGEHYHTGDFELIRGTVDGIGWYEKWPQKCEAWLDLAAVAAAGSVDDEPGYRIACDIPPSEKHPIVKDPTAPTEWTRVHRAGSVWWADGNVPKDEEADDE